MIDGLPVTDPDVKGPYTLLGSIRLHPYWKHDSAEFYICWSDVQSTWILNPNPNIDPGAGYFISENGRVQIYNGMGTWTGEAQVQQVP